MSIPSETSIMHSRRDECVRAQSLVAAAATLVTDARRALRYLPVPIDARRQRLSRLCLRASTDLERLASAIDFEANRS